MSKITRCVIYTYADSEITVTNADATTVTFSTTSIGKDHDTLYKELRSLADAYISQRDERPEFTVTATATHDGTATIVEPVTA